MVPGPSRGPSDHLRLTQRQPLQAQGAPLAEELLLLLAPHDPAFALVDSMPLPACLFARAYRCKRFRGEAAFGKDTLLKQTFYGFRIHARVSAGPGSSPASRWLRPKRPRAFRRARDHRG